MRAIALLLFMIGIANASAAPSPKTGSAFLTICQNPKIGEETTITLKALGRLANVPWKRAADCDALNRALQKMVVIDLRNEGIRDLAPVFALSHVGQLLATKNRIHSLAGLENMKNLILLDLGDNSIQDIRPILNLEKLVQLRIARNSVSELGNFSNLKNLKKISVSHNSLKSIDSLSSLNLSYLSIARNNVENISALEKMSDLETVNIADNRICSPTAVKHLESHVSSILGKSSQNCQSAADR